MRYYGGKSKIGKILAERIIKIMDQKNIQKYLEPFCGALGVAKYMCKYDIKCYCNDQSKNLIDLWKLVQTNNFINPKINKKKWFELKNLQMLDEPKINAQKAFAGYGCSFGGVYFSSYIDEDHNKTYNNLFKYDISKITFLNKDYTTLDVSKGGFLIYCDPPYYNTDNSPYKRENKLKNKKSKDFDHLEFLKIIQKWKSYGNTIIISEFDPKILKTKEIELKTKCLTKIIRKNSINNKKSSKLNKYNFQEKLYLIL